MSDAHSIFQALDAPFQNFDEQNEPIVFNGADVSVSTAFDLKIPAIAGSTIKYSFSTTLGDITFSTEFVPLGGGQGAEKIVAPMRVPSDIETIKGSYKAEKEGTFVLVFDNTFSWFNSKLLSYKVQLFQPAFTVADNNRVRQSQRLLHTTTEDTRRAHLRLITARDRSTTLGREVGSLEARIAALRLELDNKRGVLKAAQDEVDEMNLRIRHNLSKRNGLCIRCLDKRCLTKVLSFLGKIPGTYLVCKYWKACIDDEIRRVLQLRKQLQLKQQQKQQESEQEGEGEEQEGPGVEAERSS